MKKISIIISVSIIVVFATSAFSQNELTDTVQNEQNKHKFNCNLGFTLGGAGTKMNSGAVATADVGIAFDMYVLRRLSINTGFIFHQELFFNQPDREIGAAGNPFCFTIPVGIHVNIPRAEWLYAGANVALNIPIANAKRGGEPKFYSPQDVFISLPIDVGVDLTKPNGRGSKLFFRITPAFYKGGTVVPIGLVWQINFWKVRDFVAPQPVIIQPVVVSPVVVPPVIIKY